MISRALELPASARLWDTCQARTLVAHGPEAPQAAREAIDRLTAAAADGGMERLELPACEPRALLEALAQRGCNTVLWECGPDLAAAALRQGCVQRIAAVIAPKLLGGQPARTPLGHLGLEQLAGVAPWEHRVLRQLGPDLLWQLQAPPDAPGVNNG